MLERSRPSRASPTATRPSSRSALRALTAGEREVVALRLLLDLDATSTARVLGISRTACSMRLGRALRKLEEGIGAHALA